MAKKNYTKAGAKRACSAIMSKIHKLHMDGHISPQKYIKMINEVKQVMGSIKRD